jgi:hypothetical protein
MKDSAMKDSAMKDSAMKDSAMKDSAMKDSAMKDSAMKDSAMNDLDDVFAGDLPQALRCQPGERLASYEQFLAYLRLGHKRGYGALAKLLHHDVRGIERLAARYHWRERAAVFDQLLADAQLRDILREACETTVPALSDAPATADAPEPCERCEHAA